MMKRTISCDASPEKLLEHCETTIKHGIKQFLAVGEALATIRGKRLYKIKGYTTFADYCDKEWNITKAHASNLILAYEVEKELSTVVDKPVLANEHQARQYRKLDASAKEGVKQALAKGAEMPEALAAATKGKTPSDKLRIKGIVIKICRVLNSTSEGKEVYEALQPVLAWAKEYEERQQARQAAIKEDEAWMTDIQTKFPIAA